MGFLFRSLLAAFLVVALTIAHIRESSAQAVEPRLALVVGNSQYKSMPLATPANDAGLVAQTLQAAGFDVTGAADLDQNALRHVLKDFLDKVRKAPSGAVVFVYLAGRGVQFAGENYFLPTDATIQRASDVPAEALRLSDYNQALAGLPLKARVFVLDAARAHDYPKTGAPLAGGLALVDAEPGSLYALNAAPDTVAPDEPGPYGLYARALVEMMHQGFPIDEIFQQTRLRVSQTSAGAVIPWDASKIDASFLFFQRQADAPALQKRADLNKALRDYPAQDAYAIALARDTMPAYQDFLAAYPHDPLAVRIHAILAARREALTWRQAFDANSPQAYWTYTRRYPHGPHFADARRRLTLLSQPLDPPPRFDPYDFAGLPPPPEGEYEIVDRPIVAFDNPDYPPPPPLSVDILPERPVEFVHLPPPPQHELGILPLPAPFDIPFSRSAGRGPGTINQPRYGQQAPGPQTPQEAPAVGQRPAEGLVPGEENRGRAPSEDYLAPGASPLPEHPGLEHEHGDIAPGERPGPDHALPSAPAHPAAGETPPTVPQEHPGAEQNHGSVAAPDGHPGSDHAPSPGPAHPGDPSTTPQHPAAEHDHGGTPAVNHSESGHTTPTQAPRAAPEHAISHPHGAPRPTPPEPPRHPTAPPPAAQHSASSPHAGGEHKPLPKKKNRIVRANSK